jgi:hypothetical protein
MKPTAQLPKPYSIMHYCAGSTYKEKNFYVAGKPYLFCLWTAYGAG